MTAVVHQFPGRQAGAQLLTKRQLAAHLGRSTRWIELRMQEGLPSEYRDRHNRRMFDLAAVEQWLNAGRAKPATTSGERIAALEHQVQALTRTVNELKGAA